MLQQSESNDMITRGNKQENQQHEGDNLFSMMMAVGPQRNDESSSSVPPSSKALTTARDLDLDHLVTMMTESRALAEGEGGDPAEPSRGTSFCDEKEEIGMAIDAFLKLYTAQSFDDSVSDIWDDDSSVDSIECYKQREKRVASKSQS